VRKKVSWKKKPDLVIFEILSLDGRRGAHVGKAEKKAVVGKPPYIESGDVGQQGNGGKTIRESFTVKDRVPDIRKNLSAGHPVGRETVSHREDHLSMKSG